MEEYNNNPDVKDYVDRYCNQYGKTVEEALKDKVVQLVIKHYMR